MRLKVVHSDGKHAEIAPTAPLVCLGRDADCEVPFDPALYPSVSGRHAQIERTDSGLQLAHLSRNNPTLLNGQAVEGRATLAVGDSIRLGTTGPIVIVLATSLSHARDANSPSVAGIDATVAVGSQHQALLKGTAAAPQQRIEIGTGGAIGRERGKVKILLDHPQVSRFHASLAVRDGRVTITDNRSANGTYVNGARIEHAAPLDPGDRIDIGPFSLEFDGAAFVSRSRVNHIELGCHGVARVVTNRATGQPLTLLHDVHLVVRPCEFVCILGPSGSGKTTLMSILSGRIPPDEGAVTVNGANLYANFDALKQDVAVVPQKDVLHDSLAVVDALRFTAELRLPPDTTSTEIDGAVTDILSVVGLTERRETLIRHLSGGQVKRASLANELVARPSLLFLDEVTSGLDEQTDRDIMDLFRQVADGGKTVVCITHSLANVEATCHLVVVLTVGGRLACVGTPDEARAYFGIARLGDVYRKLAEHPPEFWQQQFIANPLHARYVRDRLPAGVAPARRDAATVKRETPRAPIARQALILTRRYLSIWRGDLLALATILVQSLSIAILMVIVFGNIEEIEQPFERGRRTGSLLFMLNVSCFWMACNNSAKELVKERVIFARERDVNLRIASYFISKLLVLTLFAFIQVTLMFGIAKAFCKAPGPSGQQWLVLALLSIAGTNLGLAVSALSPTEEVAVGIVPSVVMPQIILAGTLAPLSGFSKLLAQATSTAYWGKQTFEGLLSVADQKLMGINHTDFPLSVSVVAAHALAFAATALIVLLRTGRKTG